MIETILSEMIKTNPWGFYIGLFVLWLVLVEIIFVIFVKYGDKKSEYNSWLNYTIQKKIISMMCSVIVIMVIWMLISMLAEVLVTIIVIVILILYFRFNIDLAKALTEKPKPRKRKK